MPLRAYLRRYLQSTDNKNTDTLLVSVIEIRVGRTNKGALSISKYAKLMIVDVPPTL